MAGYNLPLKEKLPGKCRRKDKYEFCLDMGLVLLYYYYDRHSTIVVSMSIVVK
ncbi:MAG: hypothetical protein NC300_03925 [Bacteroidales bacterium]|nr:hypothetical protein [Clostridium sp.]MCM1203269.1 hypothetical protein [Bacteroidales bacterium]